jgi:transcriptional regulator GlxA family with amidase domain
MPKPWSGDRRVFELLLRIHRACGHYDSVADAARRYGISTSRLQHIFKAETRISISTFLLITRLHRAARALVDTHQTVKWVQFECGFADASNFAHQFRRHFGRSPAMYRSAMRSAECTGCLRQQDLPSECRCLPHTRRLLSVLAHSEVSHALLDR